MRTTGRAADRDQKRRSGSYDLPFLADRAKKGVTGKEGYEGNGLSRRQQRFKSAWGRQQGIKAPASLQVPFSLWALAC